MARSARWCSPGASDEAEAALTGDRRSFRFRRRARSGKAEGRVTLVGAGPGDPDLLTIKALRALQDADVVFYDELVSPEILDRARRDAARVPVGRRVGKPGIGQDAINKLLIEAAKSGQRAVRLKGGDPFVFGRGGEEVEALREAGVAYSVVPGITAGLGAAAQFEVPLTFRHEALRITFLTAHKAQGRRNRRLVGADRREDDRRRLHGHDRGAVDPRRPAGRRPFAANAGRRVRARDAAGCASRGRHARSNCRRWSSRSTAAPPSSSSATWSRIPRPGADPTSTNDLPNCWRLPNDLSARTEENKNHRPVGGDRQPHLGRRRDLPHRRSMAGRRTCRMPRSCAPPMKRGRCWPNSVADDVGAVGAYIAPVEIKDGGAIKPGNLREHIRLRRRHHRPSGSGIRLSSHVCI